MRDFTAEATERKAVAEQLREAARVVAGDLAPRLLDALATACAPWEWLRRRRVASHWGLGGDPEASMASLLPESRLREARAALRETVGRLLGGPRLSDKERKRRDKIVQRVLGTPRRPGHHHALIQVIALVGREVTGQDPGYTRNDYTDTVEGPWVRLIKVALEYYSGERLSESVIARELWALRRRQWKPRGITERRPREHPGPSPTRADSLRRGRRLLRGQSGAQEPARETLARQAPDHPSACRREALNVATADQGVPPPAEAPWCRGRRTLRRPGPTGRRGSVS